MGFSLPLLLLIPPSANPTAIRIEISVDQLCPLSLKHEKRVTLKECYENYVSLRSLRPSTRSGYDRVILKYFSSWLDRNLPEITDDEIVSRYASLREKSGAGQAALSMRVFKAVYAFASAKYKIPERNIGKVLRISGVVTPPVRKTRFIQKADLPRWYKGVMTLNTNRVDRTARDALLVGLFTGLRKGEIMGLKWEDVDLRNRTMTVRKTKNHRDHTLPLPDYLVRIFRERKGDTGKSPYVFPGKDFIKPVRDIDDSRLKVIKSSGVEFAIHDLRRTFATVATEVGIPPYLLKKLLNHRSGDVTEGYVISTTEILRGPMKKIASRMMEMCRAGKKSDFDAQERKDEA